MEEKKSYYKEAQKKEGDNQKEVKGGVDENIDFESPEQNLENDAKGDAGGDSGDTGGKTDSEPKEQHEEKGGVDTPKNPKDSAEEVEEDSEIEVEELEEIGVEKENDSSAKEFLNEIKKQRLEFAAEKYINKKGYEEKILDLVYIKGEETKKEIKEKIDAVNTIITKIADEKIEKMAKENAPKETKSRMIFPSSNQKTTKKSSEKETNYNYGERLAKKFSPKK